MRDKIFFGLICFIDFLLKGIGAGRCFAGSGQSPARCHEISFLTTVIVLAFGIAVPEIQAEQYRQHEAHEHGVAHLNLAVEGNNVYIEFASPAANIVGFEHHPRNEEQKTAVKNAMEKLKAAKTLFALPPGAKSQLVQSTADTDIVRDFDNEPDQRVTHSHGEIHAESHEKAHHPENHKAAKHERHSEFKADYHFICGRPEKLKYIEVLLFRIFSGIEHIEVQLITDTQQRAIELTPNRNKIVF